MPRIELPRIDRLPGCRFVAKPETARMAVAFIHGLFGHHYNSWGRAGEPATFLDRLSRDLKEVAVATYGYESGFKRAIDPQKLKVEELAQHWSDTLRDRLLLNERYRCVAIVCHSLGGVITQAALRHLIFEQPDWEQRLWKGKPRLALFFIGVPQQGTNVGPAGPLLEELKVLQHNSETVRANCSFFNDRVHEPQRARKGLGDVPIATYAVTSLTDRWVDWLSGKGTVERRSLIHEKLSHKDLVKPPLEDDFRPYRFVLDRLQAWQRESFPPRRIRFAAPPIAPYVDRPAIVKAHERVGDRFDEAQKALERGDPLGSTRLLLRGVLVAVGALESEHDGILSMAERCSVEVPEQAQALRDRIAEYMDVPHLLKHLEYAEEELEKLRNRLAVQEPDRERALAAGLEPLSELIGELHRQGLRDRRSRTGIGIEWLWKIHDHLDGDDATDDALQELVKAAKDDDTKDRLAEHVRAIRNSIDALTDGLA